MSIEIPDHKKVIMVHALDTPKSWAKGKSILQIVKEVTRWHVQERGWSDIAYALIIGPTGTVGLGRDLDGDGDVWEETGAGAFGWNKGVIHIALAGGKGGSADDQFSDHYTRMQEIALVREINKISVASGRAIVAVEDEGDVAKLKPYEIALMGHNQVANKACPCFNVKSWWSTQKAEQGPTIRPRPVPELPWWLRKLLGWSK